MENDYKREIDKFKKYQLDYNFIRKLLTIDGHYSTDFDFNTPSDLFKEQFSLYDIMLKDDTIKSIKQLHNKDVNAFLFSYSIVRNAKKAFLQSIDFQKNYQQERNTSSMKEFDKFFKFEIKYVIVIQNCNIKVIRANRDDYLQDLNKLNDNYFQVILYFVKKEPDQLIPKQNKPKEKIESTTEPQLLKTPQQSAQLKTIKIQKNIKRSTSQIKEIHNINDYYYNEIIFNNLETKQSTKRNCSISTHQYKKVSDTKNNHINNSINNESKEMIKEIKQSNNISNEVIKKLETKQTVNIKFINNNKEIKSQNCGVQNNFDKTKSKETIVEETLRVLYPNQSKSKKNDNHYKKADKFHFAPGHSTNNINDKF